MQLKKDKDACMDALRKFLGKEKDDAHPNLVGDSMALADNGSVGGTQND